MENSKIDKSIIEKMKIKKTKIELGNNTLSLCISILTFVTLFYFFISYITNLLVIVKDYVSESLLVNKTNKVLKNDNNNFEIDNIQYNNTRNEILKSIKSIKTNFTDDFKKLKKYKENTNKEYKEADKDIQLDTNLYSDVNSKILSKKYDNYKYDNSPSIFQFILDIFKPTSA
jgi:hypothetical protein|tara:strand:- start:60 stop:578 length:519 start_codon:yes stop_codon:yes gene_type:complete